MADGRWLMADGWWLTLPAFGLAVRPFGSLAFARLGDTVGRKTTFLITFLMMGTATAARRR